jgi:hypothetical protein
MRTIDGLREEVRIFETALSSISLETLKNPLGDLILQGIASNIEKLYTNGYETALTSIANDVDGLPVAASEEFFHKDAPPHYIKLAADERRLGWHTAVLQRMLTPFDDIRPSLLNPDLYSALDELRKFRNAERHKYGYELDPEKVLQHARNICAIFPQFAECVAALSHYLNFPRTTLLSDGCSIIHQSGTERLLDPLGKVCYIIDERSHIRLHQGSISNELEGYQSSLRFFVTHKRPDLDISGMDLTNMDRAALNKLANAIHKGDAMSLPGIKPKP